MGQYGKSNNDRVWKLGQQAARSCGKNIGREIKKTKKGITSQSLNQFLNCLPNFLGCFAENQFSNLIVTQYPTFVIANIDSYNMKGSHWLTIGIFRDSIEIFDPLGFTIFNWSRVPCGLLSFLHRMSATRNVLISPRIQSFKSQLCGFYCIFYLLLRPISSLNIINSFFYLVDSKLNLNDSTLYKFFQ